MKETHTQGKISSHIKPAVPELYDVDAIRQQAARTLSDGAVTEAYPLDVKKACALLNEALATEILCMLRYRHHQIIAKGINFLDIAKEFAEHAMSEQDHMMKLAERIHQLGGDPDFNPLNIAGRSAADYGEGRELRAIIKEDLIGERVVIDVYRKMISWFDKDPTTRRLLEKILADEEEHANELAGLLAVSERHN